MNVLHSGGLPEKHADDLHYLNIFPSGSKKKKKAKAHQRKKKQPHQVLIFSNLISFH